MPDPNYFADDPNSPLLQRFQKLLASIENLREEQKNASGQVQRLLAESSKKGGEAAKAAVDALRAEVRTELSRLAAQVKEVHRAAGTLEGGVGESKAALVELVAYDRERRTREEAERAKSEREQRAARAKELNRAGRAHHRAGRGEEAAAVLFEARRLAPEDAEVLSNLGAALLADGKVGPAEDPLRRAVRADESFAPARANLGFLLLRKGAFEEAEKQIEEAVRLDPALAPAWNSLGNARWLRGALVSGQVAASLALCIMAGLVGRSFLTLLPADPGFEPKDLSFFSLYLPSTIYPTASDRAGLQEEMLRRVGSKAGVTSVAFAENIPFSGDALNVAVRDDRSPSSDSTSLNADVRAVSRARRGGSR